MAASGISLTELDGVFKDNRAEQLQKAVPNFAVFQQDFPLKEQQRLGRNYIFPVHLRRSAGVTYNGGSSTGSLFDLNAVVSPIYQEAELDGSELVVREAISYAALSRGSGGDKSFATTILEVARNLKETADFHAELSIMYGDPTATGSVGIGLFSAVASSGSTRTLTISTKTWAPGIWTQLEGGMVDIYTNAGTKKNPNTIYVKTVTPDERKIVVSGASAGAAGTITATMHIVPKGFHSNSFDGIRKILTNAGTLFGISASTYNLWKANQYDAGNAPLTLGKVLAAANTAVGRGLMEDITLYVNTYSWTDLNTDHAALRRLAQSTKGGLDLGTSGAIQYYGANGTITLKPHPMLMAGDAFGIAKSRVRRLGSTPTTFKIPRVKEVGGSSEFFVMLPDSAGVQMRCYWDQAVLLTQPSKCFLIKNIVPSSLKV